MYSSLTYVGTPPPYYSSILYGRRPYYTHTIMIEVSFKILNIDLNDYATFKKASRKYYILIQPALSSLDFFSLLFIILNLIIIYGLPLSETSISIFFSKRRRGGSKIFIDTHQEKEMHEDRRRQTRAIIREKMVVNFCVAIPL